jgi:hypothetical protein
MGKLQRVVERLHLVRDLGRSQVPSKYTIRGLNCHRSSGGLLIGHVANFPGGVGWAKVSYREYDVHWSSGEEDQLAPRYKGPLHPWLLGWCETGEAAMTSHPQRLHLHVVVQHQLLGIGMQVDLLVHPRCARYRHPLRHRVPVQGVLGPVRSDVSGTISGTSPGGSPR